MKLTVTVIDTTGIQPCIFGSNRLRENVGGSYLVSQVTEDWVTETLSQDFKVSDLESPIATSGQVAEVVYMGGGNTLLLFKSHDLATKFARILSTRVLREAPGINLVVAHHDGFDSKTDSLHDIIQVMMQTDLDEKKRSRIPSSPLLGLSVTQDCLSTRLVAVGNSSSHGSPDSYPVSREIAAKLDVVTSKNRDKQNNKANLALRKVIFNEHVPNQWNIPLDFDDFGRSRGDMSYIAVVHIDGNSMGKRFQEYGKTQADEGYVHAIRRLSDSVKQAGQDSLRELTQVLVEAMPQLSAILDIESQKLPFRPLVYGGDDVTFVCDGRLGLSLAARYLKLFAQKEAADGKPLSACAGVCIVKAHYPFARAYELSTKLCDSAKKVAKKERRTQDDRDTNLSAIDWHLATSGLLGSLKEIREREYQSKDQGALTMRPLLLEPNDNSLGDWQTWENAVHLFNEFQKPSWQSKRNKIEGLREVLRNGKSATQEFLTAYQLQKLPDLPSTVNQTIRDDLAETGWHNDVCGYFDIIEALNFYTPLGGEA